MSAVVLRGRCAAPQDEGLLDSCAAPQDEGLLDSLMLRRFATQSLEALATQQLEIK